LKARLQRWSALLAAVAAVAVPLAGCSGDDAQWEGETIRLGSIFSTTGDGAAFGPQQLKAAELAVDRINEDGGVNGAELTLDQRDDAADPAASAKAMRSLIAEGEALAVLGPTFSNSSAEAHPVANRLRTPVLAVSNTGPGIVGDCPYPCEYIFRASLGEETAIPANVGDYVEAEDPRVVDILYPEGDAFGESSAATAEQAFRSAGVEKASASQVGPSGIEAITAVVRDAFMITASSGDTVVELIGQLRELGYDGTILGGNAFNSVTAARELGESGRGARSAAAWFAGNDSEENREFIEAYRSAYGEEPDQFAAQAYTGVELLAAAAADVDLTFDDLAADRRAMVPALEQVTQETPLGDFAFTADHDVSQPIWIVEMDGSGGYDLIVKVPAPTG